MDIRRVWRVLVSALLAAAILLLSAAPANAVGSNTLWKLQATGTTGMVEVEPGQLSRYREPWLQTGPRGVTLISPTQGGTSPNSDHNRTEWRELNPDGSEAAWDASTGWHAFGVRMSINRLPDNDPRLVVAQIHDGEDDNLTIRIEGRHLFVKVGDDSRPTVSLDRDYNTPNGPPFTIGFRVQDSIARVLYNGRDVGAAVRLPAGGRYFFKTGAYEQSREQPDGYAAVTHHSWPQARHTASSAGGRAPTPRPRAVAACAANTPPPVNPNTRPTLATTGPPAGSITEAWPRDMRTSDPELADETVNGRRVISGYDVKGVLTIDTPNTIVKCTEVDEKIDIASGVQGAKIWLTKIGEPNSSIGGEHGIGTHDFEATAVEIAGTTDGIKTDGPNVILEDSYLYSPYDDGKPHADGAHISTGSSKVVVRHNLIDWTATGGDTATSNVILFQEDAPVAIIGNILTGDTHSRINKSKIGSATVIRDNIEAPLP